MTQSYTSKIKFKDLDILHISKKTLKNSYIKIDNNFLITLKTPKVSHNFIYNLLEEKESWIRKQLLKIEQNPPLKVNLEDEVLLFGEIYSIDTDEASTLRMLLQKLRVINQKNILRCYDDFYKIFAQEYLLKRIEYFADIMHLSYKEIKFKKMRSRWGSCNSYKIITLNTQLLKLKKEQIDYVLVHELAHLIHMNHSKKFHSLVQNYIPNAKQIRKEIKLFKNS